VLRAALTTAAAAVLVGLAGAAWGPAAIVLALPAALAGAAVARRAEVRERSLRALSERDALTGLVNRRGMEERLSYEVARHRRHERRFSVVAMDLDGFKAVNDRFGHDAGDEVLRAVARGLRQAVRDQDTVVRLGGDEFCVLAPEADDVQASHLTTRLREAVSEAVEGMGPLGVSAGWAVFPDDASTPAELLRVADEASLAAKRRRATSRARRAA
jgi:diguanylate cyclase (GGDEF)-like protein